MTDKIELGAGDAALIYRADMNDYSLVLPDLHGDEIVPPRIAVLGALLVADDDELSRLVDALRAREAG